LLETSTAHLSAIDVLLTPLDTCQVAIAYVLAGVFTPCTLTCAHLSSYEARLRKLIAVLGCIAGDALSLVKTVLSHEGNSSLSLLSHDDVLSTASIVYTRVI